MCRERYRCGGGFSAIVAFVSVPDFAAFDEFGHYGGNQPIAAMWAALRRGEGADPGEHCQSGLELHGLNLLCIVTNAVA